MGNEIDQMAAILSISKYICDLERKKRQFYADNKPTIIRNIVLRAYSMAKFSILLSLRDSIDIISCLKWGIDLGIIEMTTKERKDIYDIYTLDIKDKFKISYRKKIANNEYYDSIEYITPRIDENYDKGLLNIVGTLKLSNNNAGISKFTTFVERFGSLYYLKDGE